MRVLVTFSLAALVSACATPIGVQSWDTAISKQVQSRAAFEFNCEKETISVTKITNKSYGAIGCDQKAVYLVSGPMHCTPKLFYGDGDLTNDICPVVLNTDVEEN